MLVTRLTCGVINGSTKCNDIASVVESAAIYDIIYSILATVK